MEDFLEAAFLEDEVMRFFAEFASFAVIGTIWGYLMWRIYRWEKEHPDFFLLRVLNSPVNATPKWQGLLASIFAVFVVFPFFVFGITAVAAAAIGWLVCTVLSPYAAYMFIWVFLNRP